jgi:hypothetical protein
MADSRPDPPGPRPFEEVRPTLADRVVFFALAGAALVVATLLLTDLVRGLLSWL